jgi:hypothetical protein
MRTFIALAVLIVLLAGYEVLAQQTCSGFYQSCLSNPLTKNPKSCDRGKANCMKTGRWIGPESGNDNGPAEKR